LFGQTFDLLDVPRVFLLCFLEILLSADNALILGLIVHHLPILQRRRALLIGLVSAFVLRGIALLSLSVLLTYRWIQMVGALYLLFLCGRYFWGRRKEFSSFEKTKGGFWKVVFLVELFDLAFALDSVLAGIAFISPPPVLGGVHPKLWIVYVGAILGMLAIRFAAQLFSSWLTIFPQLQRSAHLIVGWIGVKLAVSSVIEVDMVLDIIYWLVLVLLFLSGLRRVKSCV
jgi:YkoY family integral membrane protein